MLINNKQTALTNHEQGKKTSILYIDGHVDIQMDLDSGYEEDTIAYQINPLTN